MDARLDVDEDVLAPEELDDLGPRHEVVPPLDEQEEQVHRMALETNRAAVAAQLVGRDVELEIAEAERFARLCHWS